MGRLRVRMGVVMVVQGRPPSRGWGWGGRVSRDGSGRRILRFWIDIEADPRASPGLPAPVFGVVGPSLSLGWARASSSSGSSSNVGRTLASGQPAQVGCIYWEDGAAGRRAGRADAPQKRRGQSDDSVEVDVVMRGQKGCLGGGTAASRARRVVSLGQSPSQIQRGKEDVDVGRVQQFTDVLTGASQHVIASQRKRDVRHCLHRDCGFRSFRREAL